MHQLDNHKTPRVGSVGAQYRTTQLIVQLPLHDLSTEFCRQLNSAEERASFEQFTNQRDTDALDVGVVKDSVKRTTVCWLLESSFGLNVDFLYHKTDEYEINNARCRV